MKIDEDHTSAEMERLRVRRLWRAFAGGADPSGPRSMLGRGLIASVVLAVLVVAGTFVAGVIEATTSSNPSGGAQPVAAPTTTAVGPTPSTEPEPAPTTSTPTPTSTPQPANIDVAVSGSAEWTDTGVDVSAGDVVEVRATGTVAAAAGDPRAGFGPDGDVNPELVVFNREHNGVKVGGGHAGLIGTIGEDGKPFFIGASNSIDIDTDGRLLLGVNDSGLENNDGQFDVTFSVRRAAG